MNGAIWGGLGILTGRLLDNSNFERCFGDIGGDFKKQDVFTEFIIFYRGFS